MTTTDDRYYSATARTAARTYTNADIRDVELERARHALAYLKRKLDNDVMRKILDDDVTTMKRQVQAWLEASDGKWQTDSIELLLPGPKAADFHDWYVAAMANGPETELRAGHPEHFISHPGSDAIEVLENIGESDLPWHIFYRAVSSDHEYPTTWDSNFPVRFGAQIVDADGIRIGFTMHQSRDEGTSMRLRLTSFLPAGAPCALLERHMNHFAVEFRNWTRFAWLEALANGNVDRLSEALPRAPSTHSSDSTAPTKTALVRAAAQRTSRGNADQYTGVVLMQAISQAAAPSRLHVARVTFEPAARTAWHMHPLGKRFSRYPGLAAHRKPMGRSACCIRAIVSRSSRSSGIGTAQRRIKSSSTSACNRRRPMIGRPSGSSMSVTRST